MHEVFLTATIKDLWRTVLILLLKKTQIEGFVIVQVFFNVSLYINSIRLSFKRKVKIQTSLRKKEKN